MLTDGTKCFFPPINLQYSVHTIHSTQYTQKFRFLPSIRTKHNPPSVHLSLSSYITTFLHLTAPHKYINKRQSAANKEKGGKQEINTYIQNIIGPFISPRVKADERWKK